jgi:CRISPR type I-E-associated protein CasB/Cse2
MSDAAPTAPQSYLTRIRAVVNAIAKELANDRIPPGDRAALRRGDRPGKAEDRIGPAFWKVAVRHLEPADLLSQGDGPRRAEDERRWAAILAGLARGAELHRSGRRLGAVLAEAEVAEERLLRLARARDASLLSTVRAVAQQLTANGHRVDWADFADLILSDGTKREESVRRNLCRDFYRTHKRDARQADKEET